MDIARQIYPSGHEPTIIGLKLNQNLIRVASSRIFNDPYRAFMELVVNSIDAYNPESPIGKFGMGFMSCFYWLYHGASDITLTSKTSSSPAYTIVFGLDEKTKENITMKLLTDPPKRIHSGTSITVHGTWLDGELTKIKDHLMNLRFVPNCRVVITNPDESQTSFGEQTSKRSEVTLHNTYVKFDDWATGIPVEFAMSGLVTPSISSKADVVRSSLDVTRSRVLNDDDEDDDDEGEDEEYMSNLFITVGDIVIHSFTTDRWTGIGESYHISLPAWTPLTVARDQLIYDETTLDSFIAIFHHLTPQIQNMQLFLDHMGRYKGSANQIEVDILYNRIFEAILSNDDYLCVPNLPIYDEIDMGIRVVKFSGYDADKLREYLLEYFPVVHNENVVVLSVKMSKELTYSGVMGVYFASKSYIKSTPDWLDRVNVLIETKNITKYKQILNPMDCESFYKLHDEILSLTDIIETKFNVDTRKFIEMMNILTYYNGEKFMRKRISLFSNFIKLHEKATAYGTRMYFVVIDLPRKKLLHRVNRVILEDSIPWDLQPIDVKDRVENFNIRISGHQYEEFERKNPKYVAYGRRIFDWAFSFLQKYVKLPDVTKILPQRIWMIPTMREVLEYAIGIEDIHIYVMFIDTLLHVGPISMVLCGILERYIRTKFNAQVIELSVFSNKTDIFMDCQTFVRMFIGQKNVQFRKFVHMHEMSVDGPPTREVDYSETFSETHHTTTYTVNQLIQHLFEKESSSIFDATIPSMQSSRNKLRLVELAVDVASTRNYVFSVLTELLQNSIDAINESPIHKRQIDIDYVYADDGLGFSFTDYVGIPTDKLLFILVPFISSKNSLTSINTGEMGTGFFNVYRRAKRVIIETDNGVDHVIVEAVKTKNLRSSLQTEAKTKNLQTDRSDISYHIEKRHTTGNRATKITVILEDHLSDLPEVLPFIHSYGTPSCVINNVCCRFNGVTMSCSLTPIDVSSVAATYLSEQTSIVLTNGIPFMDLYTYLSLLGMHPETCEKLGSNLVLNISKKFYTPVHSRSKITIPMKIETRYIDEILRHLYLGVIKMALARYIIPESILPGFFSYFGDQVIPETDAVELTVNNFNIYQVQHYRFHGMDSMAELLQSTILDTDCDFDIAKKMIYQCENHELVTEFCYRWLEFKINEKHKKVEIVNVLEDDQTLPVVQMCRLVYEIGQVLHEKKGLAFDGKYNNGPCPTIQFTTSKERLGEYDPTNNTISFGQAFSHDQLDAYLTRIAKKSYNEFIQTFKNSNYLCEMLSNRDPAGTLVHEFLHFFTATKHGKNAHGYYKMEVNGIKRRLSFQDCCCELFEMLVHEGLYRRIYDIFHSKKSRVKIATEGVIQMKRTTTVEETEELSFCDENFPIFLQDHKERYDIWYRDNYCRKHFNRIDPSDYLFLLGEFTKNEKTSLVFRDATEALMLMKNFVNSKICNLTGGKQTASGHTYIVAGGFVNMILTNSLELAVVNRWGIPYEDCRYALRQILTKRRLLGCRMVEGHLFYRMDKPITDSDIASFSAACSIALPPDYATAKKRLITAIVLLYNEITKSDVDMFVCGNTIPVIEDVFEYPIEFPNYIDVAGTAKPKIQLIKRLYQNPFEVLLGFDLDSCAVAWDGEKFLYTERYIYAVNHGVNLVDPARQSPSYNARLKKYKERGFNFLIPGLASHETTVSRYIIDPEVKLIKDLLREQKPHEKTNTYGFSEELIQTGEWCTRDPGTQVTGSFNPSRHDYYGNRIFDT